MGKCDKCGKTTIGGRQVDGKNFCSQGCIDAYWVTCGKCGTKSQSDTKKCPDCGEYLHQFKTGDLVQQTKPKKKSGLLTGCAVIFAVFIGLGIIVNLINPNKVRTTNQQTQKNQAQKQNKTEPVKPLLKVTAAQILKEYEANKIAADQKYEDKDAQITGIVTSIGSDILDSLYVTLGTGGEFEMVSVQCFFDKSYQRELAKIQKGNQLTVTGHISSYTMNIIVRDCHF